MTAVEPAAVGDALHLKTDGTGTMHVRGIDISDAVTGVRIEHRAGIPVVVRVDLRGVEVRSGFGQVELPPAAVEALIALGWTPPGDEAGR